MVGKLNQSRDTRREVTLDAFSAFDSKQLDEKPLHTYHVSPPKLEDNSSEEGAEQEEQEDAKWSTFGPGLYLQYLFQSLVQRFINSLNYAFFGQYLNLSGIEYRAVQTLPLTAYSMKIFIGVLSDVLPIRGLRRKPYILGGMFVSFCFMVAASVRQKPAPYYAYDRDNCFLNKTVVGNPEAPDAALYYVTLFVMSLMFLAFADVASDALKVEYSQRESREARGTIATICAMCVDGGGIVGALIVGIALNGPAYGGSFCWDVPFRIVTGFIALCCAGSFLNTLFLVRDENKNAKARNLKKELYKFYQAFKSKEVFQSFLVLFVWAVSTKITSPAAIKVKKNWAEVTPLISTITQIVSSFFQVLGVSILKRFFLQTAWWKILLFTRLAVLLTENLVEFLTIFDYVRNPYFYFADDIIASIPESMTTLVAGLIMIEITPRGAEAMFHALFITAFVIGAALGSPISIMVTLPFDIGRDKKYLAARGGDTMDDRWDVFYSFLIPAAIQLVSLPVLALLPRQKEQVRQFRESGKKYPLLATAFIILLVICFFFTLFISLAYLIPTFNCHPFLGGRGC